MAGPAGAVSDLTPRDDCRHFFRRAGRLVGDHHEDVADKRNLREGAILLHGDVLGTRRFVRGSARFGRLGREKQHGRVRIRTLQFAENRPKRFTNRAGCAILERSARDADHEWDRAGRASHYVARQPNNILASSS